MIWLLPQRPPFVMISRLLTFEPMFVTTEFLITEDCIFVADGILDTKGIVENVAQTCAARIGYVNYIQHKQIEVGYIGAVRNMNFLRAPRVGEVLTTTVKVREEIFHMTLVDAEVRIGNELVSTAEMKIALGTTNKQK